MAEQRIDKRPGLLLQRYYELTGGVQVNVNSILARQSEFIKLLNIDRGVLGKLKKANSQTQFGVQVVDNKAFLGGYVFIDSSGTAHKLVVINNSGDTQAVLYEVGVSSNTAKYSTLTAGEQTAMVSLIDYLFVNNQTDGMLTSSDLTTFGTVNAKGAPAGKYMAEYNNELYVAGHPTYKNRIFKGKLHNPAVEALAYVSGDYTGSNTTLNVDSTKYLKAGMIIDIYTAGTTTKVKDSLTISTIASDTQITFGSTTLTLSDGDEVYIEDTRAVGGDDTVNTMSIVWDQKGDNFDLPPNGEEITGIIKSNDRLVIFQDNTMHRFDGASRRSIDDNVGCSANKSIADVGGLLFWAHKKVIYKYDGSVPVPISKAIQPILDSISDDSSWVGLGDVTGKKFACYLGDVDCDNLTASDVWAIYDIDTDSWDFRSDMPATISFRDKTATGGVNLYIGDADGNVYQFDYGTSSNVHFEAAHKFDSQNDPESIKTYYGVITVSPKPGGIISYATDYDDQNYIETEEIRNKLQFIPFGRGIKANNISIAWGDDESGNSPELEGWGLLYEVEGLPK